MQSHTNEVVAPSRLHFGLFTFKNADRCFGGVGAMIDEPSTCVRFQVANEFASQGEHSERCTEFARRWAKFHDRELPACRIEVVRAPRQHTGLGVGTQLGLAVGAGLSALYELPFGSPAELAISVGRGLRSAVGTHGFGEGGLIVDGGKSPSDAISPLHCRLDIPDAWRFVLISPHDKSGLHGDDEQQAFASLPVVSQETTEQLQREVREHMVPSLAANEYESFSESVTRYGRLAGLCFKEQQGGPYNGPHLTAIVDAIQSWGIRGVGQSSWGPTLFSIVPNQTDAEQLVEKLSDRFSADQHDIWISPPNNCGARVTKVANP